MNTERESRIGNILSTRSAADGYLRAQSSAPREVEKFVAVKICELLDGVLPHIKQIQERQSLEEHYMRLLEETVQALR